MSDPTTQPPLTARSAALGSNSCEPLNLEDAVKHFRNGQQTIWIDLEVHDLEVGKRLLQDEFGFHELAVEDALSHQERPALREYGETVFLSLPVISMDGERIHFDELGIFLAAHGIVTVHLQPIELVNVWYARWSDFPHRIGGAPTQVLYVLMDAIVDAYFPILDVIEDIGDDLTDAILRGETSNLPKILRVKRGLLEIRRSVGPMRDIVNGLLRRDLHVVTDDARPYFQDIYDHVLRLSELVDMNRDATTGLLDIHLASVSNNLNEVVKKMTVLSTVLMTMALIAGIYGMNFKDMPELVWTYGYPFAIFLMLAASGLVIYAFRRMRWI